jgi:AcrR family transcriptional regulator
MTDDKRLSTDDWLRAGRLALLHDGPSGVRVEKLARDLKVTKGSFYWHFRDRGELLEALLREWEAETSMLFSETSRKGSLQTGIAWLFDEIGRRVVGSERGEMPSDAAMFGWAAVSPPVAKRINRVEEQRITFLARLAGSRERAHIAYLAYVGFIMRRRRVPGLNETFPVVAAAMLDMLTPAPTKRSRRIS